MSDKALRKYVDAYRHIRPSRGFKVVSRMHEVKEMSRVITVRRRDTSKN
jgi:hypothetical protein